MVQVTWFWGQEVEKHTMKFLVINEVFGNFINIVGQAGLLALICLSVI